MNNKIHNFGWLSIFMVVAIGLLDLIGCFYKITFLKSILSNWAPMKMITACCLLASAASIAISVAFRNRSPFNLLSTAIGIFTGVIGITTVDSYLNASHKTVVYHFPFLNFYLSPENRMALTLPLKLNIHSLHDPAVKTLLPEDNLRPDRINNQN